MTGRDDFDRSLTEWLTAEAGEEEPVDLNAILGRVDRTRQRPAWAHLPRIAGVDRTLRRMDLGPAIPIVVVVAALVLAVVAAIVAGSIPRPRPGLPAVVPIPSAPTSPPAVVTPDETAFAQMAFQGSDFYAVPDPLLVGEAGALIYLERIADDNRGRVYRVLYHTRTVDDRDTAASGTIWLPASPPPDGGYPIVLWAMDDQGPADICAASRLGGDAFEINQLNAAMLDRLRDEGYVVAYTDFPGHGTSIPYPASVAPAAARGVLDAARAARQLLGVAASDRVVLFGHGGGADAVTTAAELAAGYAPELDIRGVIAAEGGAADHETALAQAIAEDQLATGLLIAANGYTIAYPELRAEDVLTPAALEALPMLDEDCFDPFQGHLNGMPVSAALRVDPMDLPEWATRIKSMTVTRAPVPTFLMASGKDPTMYQALQDLTTRFCRENDAVMLRIYREAEPPPTVGSNLFTGVLVASWPDARHWIADRFAGVAAVGSCP
jgi:pimeloyl-ACP methyl ester carboxylesterase